MSNWSFIKRLHQRQNAMKFKKLTPFATVPTRGTEQSAGLDLYSPYSHVITPGETKKIPLEIASQFIPDRVAVIKGRSSMAAKGIHVVGGVIDSDYRGPWAVLLYNSTDKPYFISCDDRVAQVILTDCFTGAPQEVTEFDDETERGEGGFGSTGQ